MVYGHKVGVSLAAALALATAWYAAAKSKKAARVKGMPGKVAVITGASSPKQPHSLPLPHWYVRSRRKVRLRAT